MHRQPPKRRLERRPKLARLVVRHRKGYNRVPKPVGRQVRFDQLLEFGVLGSPDHVHERVSIAAHRKAPGSFVDQVHGFDFLLRVQASIIRESDPHVQHAAGEGSLDRRDVLVTFAVEAESVVHERTLSYHRRIRKPDPASAISSVARQLEDVLVP